MVADGSIQGFSARLKWPHYYNGAENGLWYIEPERLAEYLKAFTKAGIQVHVHTNGDEATEVALDKIDEVLREHPWPDHRHTIQHCQMATRAHFKRMKTLGVGVNLFSNHLYYWGDAHINITMGPERAARLEERRKQVALAEHLRRYSPHGARSIGCLPAASLWAMAHKISALKKRYTPSLWALLIR